MTRLTIGKFLKSYIVGQGQAGKGSMINIRPCRQPSKQSGNYLKMVPLEPGL